MLTSKEYFNTVVKLLADKTRDKGYIDEELIMIPELAEVGLTYSMEWLKNEDFKAVFKGNTTGYYLGLCANAIGGGMLYANAWADNIKEFNRLRYDEIYDGGVWNNVFVLLEMTDDNEKKDFQNFIIEMYEKWVVLLKDYFKNDNANEYILKTLSAFFQLGVSLRLDILGY